MVLYWYKEFCKVAMEIASLEQNSIKVYCEKVPETKSAPKMQKVIFLISHKNLPKCANRKIVFWGVIFNHVLTNSVRWQTLFDNLFDKPQISCCAASLDNHYSTKYCNDYTYTLQLPNEKTYLPNK